MLYGIVNEIVKSFPVEYNTMLDFYNKVILAAVTEIKELAIKIINVPSFRKFNKCDIERVGNFLALIIQYLHTNLILKYLIDFHESF